MISFLKNHPFAVETHFKNSTVLTFAVPKEKLETFIPECLELDIFKEKWAFIAVAMVNTKHLRPKGFPKCLGNNFFLIGYRIFVRYKNNAGKRLRGLYILKSETNKKKIEFLGSIFTKYNYSTTDISETFTQNSKTIVSTTSKFTVELNTTKKEAALPFESPFKDWKEAKRFAGPLPFTFSFNKEKNEVLIIEGVRQNWKPKPLEVIDCNFSFINNFKFENCVLASAFTIENIPYYWKKGKIELWKN